jgi:mannose-1-phosphate guanylyltransferase
MATSLWAIVLAAGAGRRLASLTGGVPKQYWKPEGVQSLLESTIDRLGSLVVPERTITVVDETHREHLRGLERRDQLGAVLYQPMDRGTAAGVLLPLAAVVAQSPDAIVVITPSDHGIDGEACFRHGLRRAMTRVQSGVSQVVLFGTEPTAVTMDFGWILPGGRCTGDADFLAVRSFVEKPPMHEALRLYSSGAVWNTMVVVARAGALIDLYRRLLPFHADVILTAHGLEADMRQTFLQEWYRDLPPADFCRDLLSPARGLCLYTFPAEMGWSDLGTPERMTEWIWTTTGRAPLTACSTRTSAGPSMTCVRPPRLPRSRRPW